jgi:hypothetical protein
MTTTDLARLIRDRLAALDLSYRQAAARSRGMLTHGSIGAIVTGKHGGKLSERTIDGLVLALGIPRTEIEKAIGIYRDRPAEPFRLPEELNRLNRKERSLLIQLGTALLAAREEGLEGAEERRWGEADSPDSGSAAELPPEEIEAVVIERLGRPPFAVARSTALGPMSEHERAQHIAKVEQLEQEMQRLRYEEGRQSGP